MKGVSSNVPGCLAVKFDPPGGMWARHPWMLQAHREICWPGKYRTGDLVYPKRAQAKDEDGHAIPRDCAGVVRGICGADTQPPKLTDEPWRYNLIIRWDPPNNPWFWAHMDETMLTDSPQTQYSPGLDGYFRQGPLLIEIQGRTVIGSNNSKLAIQKGSGKNDMPIWFLEPDALGPNSRSHKWYLDEDKTVPTFHRDDFLNAARRAAKAKSKVVQEADADRVIQWIPLKKSDWTAHKKKQKEDLRKMGYYENQEVWTLKANRSRKTGRTLAVGDRGIIKGTSDNGKENQVNIDFGDHIGRWNMRTRNIWSVEEGYHGIMKRRVVGAKGRFLLCKVLAAGSFGVVFKGFDTKHLCAAAIKLEWPKNESSRSQWARECKLLDLCSPFGCVPELLWKGEDTELKLIAADVEKFGRKMTAPPYKVTVMRMEGDDLVHVFHNKMSFELRMCRARLIGKAVISCIQKVHKIGIVHRDIKPQNFLVGRNEPNRVYAIDFGLSAYWQKSGRVIPHQMVSKPCGTARYASLNTHRKNRQSRRDDLEAIGYMLIYFCKGRLPWQGSIPKDKKKWEYVLKKKEGVSIEKLCDGLGAEWVNYVHYCRSLDFYDKPDYAYLQSLFN